MTRSSGIWKRIAGRILLTDPARPGWDRIPIIALQVSQQTVANL
jgi:hypothetical protein